MSPQETTRPAETPSGRLRNARRPQVRRPQVRRPHPRRQGLVLLVVLVVVAALSFSAYTFTELMLIHDEAAIYAGRQIQARMLVDSGADTVRWFLTQDPATRLEAGGSYNNPMLFQGVSVLMDETLEGRGNFTMLAPALDEQGMVGGIRYGLENESARLNLNFLIMADQLQEGGGRNLLLALPGMTEEIADAILDWIDPDDEPREFGAEIDYYSTLDPPYEPRNGYLASLEELLLVRGITPQLLFGSDLNQNGLVDPHEAGLLGAAAAGAGLAAPAGGMPAMTTGTGTEMDRGWSAYLTLHSKEANLDSSGLPRIDVNMEDLEQLSSELSEVFDPSWVTFILAYRLSGPYDGNEDGEVASGDLDLSEEGGNRITRILDLVGAKVQVRFDGADEDTVLASPFVNDIGAMNTYLPALLDKVTVVTSETIPGRININQAPRTVLLGLVAMGMLSEEEVDLIIETRGDPAAMELEGPETFRFETWLLTEGILFSEAGEPDLERMKTLVPFLCAGGDVYRTQIVGYFQEGGASSRAEVVFDGTSLSARILFWRDMSHLGRGYPIELLGVDLLDPTAQP